MSLWSYHHHRQPSSIRSTARFGDLSFLLQHPPSPSTSSSPMSSLSSYQSSPESIPSRDFSLSSTTPPPFYHPADHPPPYSHRLIPPQQKSNPKPRHVDHPSRVNIAHPYARLYAKKDTAKRRKIWNHLLEKDVFTPHELSSMGAPQRRTIYIASLEAHVDQLHSRMYDIGVFPIDVTSLDRFKGLNSKTAKSMVAGLQYDVSQLKLKLLELRRSNERLRNALAETQLLPTDLMRQGSQDDVASSACPKPEAPRSSYQCC